MRKKFKKRFRKYNDKPRPIQSILETFIASRPKIAQMTEFYELWSNWDMIFSDIAPFAKPLGVRQTTLCIGVENNFELQEVRMEYDSLLARANAFMQALDKENYFKKLEISLFQGKSPITLGERRENKLFNYYQPPKPEKIGAVIDFKEETLLAKCYEAYCQRLQIEDE